MSEEVPGQKMSTEKWKTMRDPDWTSAPANGSDRGSLPKSELNPLLNPLLEKNLGRWAQVYFTNPPETREKAVMALLRELESQPEPNPTPAPSAAGPRPSQPAESEIDRIVCPSCERGNRAGQRFCGFCGAPLSPPAARAAASARAPASVSPPEPPVSDNLSFLGLSSSASTGDLEFLRGRSFSHEYYEPAAAGRLKYLVALVVLLLAGIGYLEWPALAARFATLQHPASTVVAQSPAPQSQVPNSSLPDHASEPPSKAVQPPLAAQPAGSSASGDATLNRAAESAAPPDVHKTAYPTTKQSLKLASRTQATPAQPDGSEELSLAEQYLEGSRVPRNTAVAARWLWKAVGKQNTTADTLLADLYARGDGVPKNCDQARMLLTAAAEKGDPLAAQHLRTLESGGCR